MYKLLLILKYLRKRRIAWVSLAAVMLCTMMVLVVISIMGGWLRMFRAQFKGLSGDIVVDCASMTGFPYYEQMLGEIRKLPEVKAAAPVVQTYGLISINRRYRDGVMVVGYPSDIQQVNSFRDSCFRIGGNLSGVLVADELAQQLLAAKDPEKAAADPQYAAKLPGAARIGLMSGRTYRRFDPAGSALARDYLNTRNATPQVRVRAAEDDRDRLVVRAGNIDVQAISPAGQVNFSLWPDENYYPPAGYKGPDPKTWTGMVAGSGVVGLRKDEHGRINRPPWLYKFFVDLTVIPTSPDSSKLDLTEQARRFYWIIDDSRTKATLYDQHYVYVPFDTLQKDLLMDAQGDEPARCSAIQVALKDSGDANAVAPKIKQIVGRIVAEKNLDPELIRVKTWEVQHATFLSAVENEKFLVTFICGIISIVAVFLIFCIFYMIVAEKTRDIGIIKSVGATSQGVAGIFLGYGFTIGLVGAGLGLLSAYLIVHNINEIHDFMGQRLGLVIWNPEVYIFDTIPNTMDPFEVTIIVSAAILSAVLGALVPAIRAAMLHPVEALRWE
ncbi:MAG: ABC transporter permease [Tepidisphaerales bacterium]